MGVQWDLPKSNCFLKVVDQWYFRYEGDSIEDREDALLKDHYPSKNYKKRCNDIKIFLEDNYFEHRQYSGYVSKENVFMTDVGSIIDDMIDIFEWLRKYVLQIDVTIVGNEYSFLSKIQKENKMN